MFTSTPDHLMTNKLGCSMWQSADPMEKPEERRFCIQTLDEATHLGQTIAQLFPDPKRTTIGLTELLINAVEHGNLGISYEEKGQLMRTGKWEEEVCRRQRLPENAHKQVSIYYRRNETLTYVDIHDEGAGFDWERYLTISPERATDLNGRGIAMARSFSFDQLEFLGAGNVVRAGTQLAPLPPENS